MVDVPAEMQARAVADVARKERDAAEAVEASSLGQLAHLLGVELSAAQCVVAAADHAAWLTGSPVEAATLLRTPPPEFFEVRALGPYVGSVHHEGPECDAPRERQ